MNPAGVGARGSVAERDHVASDYEGSLSQGSSGTLPSSLVVPQLPGRDVAPDGQNLLLRPAMATQISGSSSTVPGSENAERRPVQRSEPELIHSSDLQHHPGLTFNPLVTSPETELSKLPTNHPRVLAVVQNFSDAMDRILADVAETDMSTAEALERVMRETREIIKRG